MVSIGTSFLPFTPLAKRGRVCYNASINVRE